MKDRLMMQKMKMSISKHMNITYMFISNLITRGNMKYVKMAIQLKKISSLHMVYSKMILIRHCTGLHQLICQYK